MNKHLGTLNINNIKIEPECRDCCVCNSEIILGSEKNTTHSLLAEKDKTKTYFFRTHKKCWDNLKEKEKKLYNDSFVDNI